MAGFFKKIVVNNKHFDFEFIEIHSPSGIKYFVTVRNDFKTIGSFEMKNGSSGWSIVPPSPGWINELQEQLELAIAENPHRIKNGN
jgi:hypothetical protein